MSILNLFRKKEPKIEVPEYQRLKRYIVELFEENKKLEERIKKLQGDVENYRGWHHSAREQSEVNEILAEEYKQKCDAKQKEIVYLQKEINNQKDVIRSSEEVINDYRIKEETDIKRTQNLIEGVKSDTLNKLENEVKQLKGNLSKKIVLDVIEKGKNNEI